MREPLIDVKDLKTYFFLKRGVVKAVDGISFSLNKGDSMGLVGESGCGKSVTMKSILRLEPKPAGQIVGGKINFEGEDLTQADEERMRSIRGGRISLIMQNALTSLNPVYTIGNQLMETIKLHTGIKDKKLLRRKAVEALERVRIPEAATRLDAYSHQLSGGMRQRVAGAIAMSCNPSLLIADEPTTALDVTTQMQYLYLLNCLREETGVSLIMVTHDLGIVAKMCKTVCVMYMGKTVERGDVKELWYNARHPYTIALMKSVPSVEEKRDELYSISGVVPSSLNMPKGCSFHPRCDRAVNQCRQEEPPELNIGANHFVRCWKNQE